MFAHLDDPDPPGYDAGVETAVRVRAGQIRRRRWSLRAAVGAIGAAVIVGVVLGSTGGRTVEVTTTPSTAGPPRLPAVTGIDGSFVRAGPTPTQHLRRTDFAVVATLPASSQVVTLDGALYVVSAGNRLERVDPASGRVMAATRLSALTRPLAEASGRLWVQAGHDLVELNPATLERVGTFPAPGKVSSVAVAGGDLWYVVAANSAAGGTGPLYRQALTGGAPRVEALPAGVDTASPSRLLGSVVANAAGTELAATLSGNLFVTLDPRTGTVIGRFKVVEANNVTIGGIAGDIAWYVGGVGHNNVLGAVNLRTGQAVPIIGTPTVAPHATMPASQGGWVALTGNTVLETFYGEGPDICIAPTTGRARSYLFIPATLRLLGVAGHQLLAETLASGIHQELLRTTVQGCR